MNTRYTMPSLLLALSVFGCGSAQPDLEPQAVQRGARLAKSCMACHSLTSPQNRIGPHLVGIVGRKAGSASGYSYSTNLGTSEFSWTTEKLAEFIENPSSVIPNTNMTVANITREQALDIIAYLQSLDH